MSELSDATARLIAATQAVDATVTNLAAEVAALKANPPTAPAEPDPDVPAALTAMNDAAATMESLASQNPGPQA